MNTLGQRIAHYRRRAGFRTPAELVATLPEGTLTAATLQNIESGRKKQVGIGELLYLAKAMQLMPATLVANPRDPMGPSMIDGFSNWEATALLDSRLGWRDVTDQDELQIIQWLDWIMSARESWESEVASAREGVMRGLSPRDAWLVVEALRQQAISARRALIENGIDVSWADGPWFSFRTAARFGHDDDYADRADLLRDQERDSS